MSLPPRSVRASARLPYLTATVARQPRPHPDERLIPSLLDLAIPLAPRAIEDAFWAMDQALGEARVGSGTTATSLVWPIFFAVSAAGYGGIWRDMAGYGGIPGDTRGYDRPSLA